jgi:hypothetical protein
MEFHFFRTLSKVSNPMHCKQKNRSFVRLILFAVMLLCLELPARLHAITGGVSPKFLTEKSIIAPQLAQIRFDFPGHQRKITPVYRRFRSKIFQTKFEPLACFTFQTAPEQLTLRRLIISSKFRPSTFLSFTGSRAPPIVF